MQVGELVGGSQREERLDVLERRYDKRSTFEKFVSNSMAELKLAVLQDGFEIVVH